jgi:UDP-N-acetylglucosamine 1-carboxyvinyltransferase
MEKLIIIGGKKLHGSIKVKGAKNHALKMIPAAFLVAGRTVIKNIPHVEDVERMLEIVEAAGGKVERIKRDTVAITPPKKFNGNLPRELMPKLRASLVLLGPLLARYKKVELPHPGGCNLGKRPINFFIEGFKEFGAKVIFKNDAYQFKALNGLKAINFVFPNISVTGTETLMLAAVLAKGRTTLINCACEPEIKALADYLNSVGAKIHGAGTATIIIEGSAKLLNSGTAHIIPDRIEAGSFAIMAAATRSKLIITDCEPKHLEIPLKILEKAGVKIETGKNYIKVFPNKKIKPIDIATHEYPGFPTDLQAPMTVLLTQAEGDSIVRETIYEGRLFYTDSLNNMGAKIFLASPFRAIVHGPRCLRGKRVVSPDIRAGIAMVIAALVAKGRSEIENIYQIDRGYENIDERLKKIGANIWKSKI